MEQPWDSVKSVLFLEKLSAALHTPRAGGGGGGRESHGLEALAVGSCGLASLFSWIPAAPNPTILVPECCTGARMGKALNSTARRVGASPVGNGKSLHCTQVLEALQPLPPEAFPCPCRTTVVKVKSELSNGGAGTNYVC